MKLLTVYIFSQTWSSSSNGSKVSKGKRNHSKNTDDVQQRLWNSVRANNGIRVLLSLLNVKTPMSDADSIRALACRALCGLARSDEIRQIMGKLAMVHSGQLQRKWTMCVSPGCKSYVH